MNIGNIVVNAALDAARIGGTQAAQGLTGIGQKQPTQIKGVSQVPTSETAKTTAQEVKPAPITTNDQTGNGKALGKA